MNNDPNQTKVSDYYTAEEIADLLRVHWQTVLDYIRSGQLEAVKLGKSYRVSTKSLNKFLVDRTIGTPSLAEVDLAKVNERLTDMESSHALKSKRVLSFSASFSPAVEIENLFTSSANNGFVELLQAPPITREMGWTLRNSYERPKAVLGEYLEVHGGNETMTMFLVRLYKDGNLLASASTGFEYLGWQVNFDEQRRPTDGNNINGMAVADYIFNYSLIACAMLEKLEQSPEYITLRLHISNPNKNKMINVLMGPMGPMTRSYGDAVQKKEAMIQTEFKLDGKPEPAELAACLWKEYGHVFGLLDDEIAFLSPDRKKFNDEVFK